MFKKITACAAAAFIAGASAGAYEVSFDYEDGAKGTAFALVYDAEKKLEEVRFCEVSEKDGICSAEFWGDEDKTIKLFFPASGKLVSDFTRKETEQGNGEEAEPDNKDNKEENKDDDKKRFPDVYPTELDAATAYMMVKDVGKSAEGDDIKTKLTVFFRGEEKTLTLDENAELDFASDANYLLEGEPVTQLKPGDIIYCSTNLSGKIRTVELIFRPADYDIITGEIDYGSNFEELYATNGAVTTAYPTPITAFGASTGGKRAYAFGLIRECGAGYVTLCNKNGKNLDIDISENTIVYAYDSKKKNGSVRIGDISDILPSTFGADAEDDFGNIIDMNDYFEHNYALVRTCDGSATEIAVYLNY